MLFARTIAILILTISLGGCLSQRSNDTPASSGQRFLALGDSYTIGEGVAPEDRWPTRLAELLRGRGIDVGAPEIIARTGWTTDELSTAIDAAAPVGPYQLVSLLIGVNNQYRGRSIDEYRSEFSQLLDRALEFAGHDPRRVIVLSIPDWGVTPFARANGRDPEAVAREIDAHNATARELATVRGVAFFDVTTISRRAGSDASLLTDDALHPSARMYDEWAAAIVPIVAERLPLP